jgi:predicted nuclease of restriction endonuclease-like (RecB) superfamily
MEIAITDTNYKAMLGFIVNQIRTTRAVAARRVNRSVIEGYWNIGKRLSEEHLEKGYGAGVVERLSADLKQEFPGASGFSPRNLWDMKRFYEFYRVAPDALGDEKLRQAVAELPWGHHLLILNKVKERAEAAFYVESAVEMGWTRDVLLNFIKADTYQHSKVLPKDHNFDRTLPENLRTEADELLKSTYNLDFLGIIEPVKERELERRLVEKIRLFLLDLGSGVAFIGEQYRLLSAGKEYFVDMLFFNRRLKSLVAIDLKIGSFEPEYVGKMNFYLGLLDDQTRLAGENPSVGIILCAEKNHVDVEIALRDVNKPIGVADYQAQFKTPELKALIEAEMREEGK